MENVRMHSPTLVDQALLVSQELIRVAILWHEIFMQQLEEASRLYFANSPSKFTEMLHIVDDLHNRLQKGADTLREIAFIQAYGRELKQAHAHITEYKKTNDVAHLQQGWQIYQEVHKRLGAQVSQIHTLELAYISPNLLKARDLELAVPGTYNSNQPLVKISSFLPTVDIFTSKQRPRKLNLIGSDGREYQFLLKGHEDLRLDERVMQLFGLINTLLSVNPETFKRHLSITRYTVTPLTPNIGLLGWVPNCDTLHTLIRDYRESKKILLNIEHRIMLQVGDRFYPCLATSNLDCILRFVTPLRFFFVQHAPDYDSLPTIHKVEAFTHAMNNTTGTDLANVLWLKSRNSEAWLERRTNYTRSLALMSMVGYILGLGDRHPSNIMLDRISGKIVHIDFGDCFEVCMN
jgi:FKBP12-rapamycin complex-associated protein